MTPSLIVFWHPNCELMAFSWFQNYGNPHDDVIIMSHIYIVTKIGQERASPAGGHIDLFANSGI